MRTIYKSRTTKCMQLAGSTLIKLANGKQDRNDDIANIIFFFSFFRNSLWNLYMVVYRVEKKNANLFSQMCNKSTVNYTFIMNARKCTYAFIVTCYIFIDGHNKEE